MSDEQDERSPSGALVYRHAEPEAHGFRIAAPPAETLPAGPVRRQLFGLF